MYITECVNMPGDVSELPLRVEEVQKILDDHTMWKDTEKLIHDAKNSKGRKIVQQWTEEDFAVDRETLVSRLAGMRMRAINQALRKGQLQSAAQMMDALGRVVGESMPETLAIQAPDLKITIEDNK